MKQVFGTGLSRSGGALYSSVLSAHPRVEMACCPNLEFFKYLRSSAALHLPVTQIEIPTDKPLSDWYFCEEGERRLFTHIQSQLNLNLDFPEQWHSRFVSESKARGSLESPDIAARFAGLQGGTFREILDRQLEIIHEVRGNRDTEYVGFHETWSIDFFPALARTFPDANFIIMLRDPRAIINSVKGIERSFPEQVVDIVSYARQWRKYVALVHTYSLDPMFKGRLVVSSHDAVMRDPDREFGEIMKLLGLDLQSAMLDHRNFRDPHTMQTWSGNSSFDHQITGFSTVRSLRWSHTLKLDVVALIEYLCGPDFPLAGIEPVTVFGSPYSEATDWLVDCLEQDLDGFTNWRGHDGHAKTVVTQEGARRLQLSGSQVPERDLVESQFLFPTVFESLRSHWKAGGVGPAPSPG